MSKKNRKVLKSYFETGKKPTEEQYAQLIDATLNFEDDGVKKDDGEPLGITAVEVGSDDPKKKELLRFYDKYATEPNWLIRLEEATGEDSGMSVSKLLIENKHGYIGVGAENSPENAGDILLTSSKSLHLILGENEGSNHAFTIRSQGKDYASSAELLRVTNKGNVDISRDARINGKLITSGGCFNAATIHYAEFKKSIKIETNIPATVAGDKLPVFIIEGHNFTLNQTIGITVAWKVQGGNITVNSQKWGEYQPEIDLSSVEGKIVLFIGKADNKESTRTITLNVRTVGKIIDDNAQWYQGWRTIDTASGSVEEEEKEKVIKEKTVVNK